VLLDTLLDAQASRPGMIAARPVDFAAHWPLGSADGDLSDVAIVGAAPKDRALAVGALHSMNSALIVGKVIAPPIALVPEIGSCTSPMTRTACPFVNWAASSYSITMTAGIPSLSVPQVALKCSGSTTSLTLQWTSTASPTYLYLFEAIIGPEIDSLT